MWPFWAPSRAALVDRALDLADVRPGERFLDLGCGDGRTLERAARRGAVVAGIEADPALAEKARRRLARAGVTGEVVAGDIFDSPLDADVLFTYLAPATLQQLTPRLLSASGGRLVTVDFPVPELEADDEEEGVYLYRLPGVLAGRNGHVGWPSAGALAVVPPRRQSLTVLELHHPGGPVSVTPTPALAPVVTVATGLGRAEPRQVVAVDLRWEEAPEGTFAHGRLEVPGVRPFPLFVLFAHDEDGLWELNDLACRALLRRARTAPRPASLAELLGALE
jgi:SAM-dependent methyltransferase